MFSASACPRCRVTVLATLIIVCAGSSTRSLADQPTSSDRYGPFGLLDHRSIYGTYWYPEPLRADESDVDNEVRLDWFHGAKRGRQDDELKMEIEKSVGLFTFEIAPTWQSDRTHAFNPHTGLTDR